MSQIVETWAEYKGSRYNATYSEETQSWDVDIPAGAESSYGQPNHTYPITLHAKDAAGNETVMQATDPTYGDQLNIRFWSVLVGRSRREEDLYLSRHKPVRWFQQCQPAGDR